MVERLLRGAGSTVLFEEAYPAPEEAMAPAGEPAVTEFLIELNERGAVDA